MILIACELKLWSSQARMLFDAKAWNDFNFDKTKKEAVVQNVVHKQVGVLNRDGYYDCFDRVEEGFINPSATSIVIPATSAAELLQRKEVL